VDAAHVPAHVAIIMDGNGRWAQARGLPRIAGHRAGTEAFRSVVDVNLLGQLAAVEALKHQDRVAERRETNARLRDLMVARLAERGRATVPTQANFMLVDMNGLRDPHDKVCGTLLSQGAIVRDGNALGCPGWARVTVGTEEEIEFFLEQLASLEAGGPGAGEGRRR
jgi:histidinol-phosphate aminotransferase